MRMASMESEIKKASGNITMARLKMSKSVLPRYPIEKPLALTRSCCSGNAISGKYEL